MSMDAYAYGSEERRGNSKDTAGSGQSRYEGTGAQRQQLLDEVTIEAMKSKGARPLFFVFGGTMLVVSLMSFLAAGFYGTPIYAMNLDQLINSHIVKLGPVENPGGWGRAHIWISNIEVDSAANYDRILRRLQTLPAQQLLSRWALPPEDQPASLFAYVLLRSRDEHPPRSPVLAAIDNGQDQPMTQEECIFSEYLVSKNDCIWQVPARAPFGTLSLYNLSSAANCVPIRQDPTTNQEQLDDDFVRIVHNWLDSEENVACGPQMNELHHFKDAIWITPPNPTLEDIGAAYVAAELYKGSVAIQGFATDGRVGMFDSQTEAIINTFLKGIRSSFKSVNSIFNEQASVDKPVAMVGMNSVIDFPESVCGTKPSSSCLGIVDRDNETWRSPPVVGIIDNQPIEGSPDKQDFYRMVNNITVESRPWGAVTTVVVWHLPGLDSFPNMTQEAALLVVSGTLSATSCLQSRTTTNRDREAVRLIWPFAQLVTGYGKLEKLCEFLEGAVAPTVGPGRHSKSS